jgi:peptide/nickel transport system substrate-binding protein
MVGIFINLRNPNFNDKEVRQALALGTPAFPDYEKAISPLSPLSWAYSRKIRVYNYDPEAAIKILSKSPFASESSELVLSTFPSLLSSAQTIADTWNKLGVKTRVKVENSIPSDYDVMLLVQSIPPDPDQYQYWQSTQEGTNLTHYNNPKIDKFLEDGRKEIDKDKRMKIYADFQRYLVDDVPVIFMYYPKSYTVERK